MPDGVLVSKIPCLRIHARDWLDSNDVREWLSKVEDQPATWINSSGYSDVFIVYDHGHSSDRPEMPRWLWKKVERLVKIAELNYCVVWLMDA